MKVAIIAFLVLAFYIFLHLRMTYRSTSMNVKKEEEIRRKLQELRRKREED
ncbi:hypothetical protein [Paenibacillus larvae]|uniref:hypothetical protein n=1 Tax=Paenibacillus larvae TaxID=1464 RepID=UPI001314621C|nr:hypothetical protein [Paenibacillus larvae]